MCSSYMLSPSALKCDIPGECIGQIIAFSSQNSSNECLTVLHARVINVLLSDFYLKMTSVIAFQIIIIPPPQHQGVVRY